MKELITHTCHHKSKKNQFVLSAFGQEMTGRLERNFGDNFIYFFPNVSNLQSTLGVTVI